MKILCPTWFVLFCNACLVLALPSNAAEDGARIAIMAVEDPNNYDAVNSMRDFADKELRPLGHHVDLLEGNKALPTDFPGLVEAMRTADLLIVFVRRATLPKAQLDAIRKHLAAGKPLLGIRTANHGFVPPGSAPITDPRLAAWPEFTPDVLGGQNTGYETKGMPYSVSLHPQAPKNSPLLAGIKLEATNPFIRFCLSPKTSPHYYSAQRPEIHPPNRSPGLAVTAKNGPAFFTPASALRRTWSWWMSAACWSTRSSGHWRVTTRTINRKATASSSSPSRALKNFSGVRELEPGALGPKLSGTDYSMLMSAR